MALHISYYVTCIVLAIIFLAPIIWAMVTSSTAPIALMTSFRVMRKEADRLAMTFLH